MQITAQMVNELRAQTGAGLMQAKKALVETDGDMAKASDLLRVEMKGKIEKRAARSAAEGIVTIAHSHDAVSLIELNSETDFVARNEDFKAVAHEIAAAHAHNGGEDVEALMNLTLASGQTVRQRLDDAISKIGENLVLRRIARFDLQADSVTANYIHAVDNKTGVLVELKGDPSSEAQKEVAKNIAMHIAFTKPKYMTREEVPADAVEHEKEVLTKLTLEEGKPEAAIPKIVEGRLGKFYEGLCLLDQPYVREQSKKISQLAQEAGAEVRRFALFVVGQE